MLARIARIAKKKKKKIGRGLAQKVLALNISARR